MIKKICYLEPGAGFGTVAGTGAGQDWTGSTTLLLQYSTVYFIT